jgi:predicted lipoprotein with Yx(FWY)xxD motif
MIRIAIATAACVCALSACSSSGSASHQAPSNTAPPAGSSSRVQPGTVLSAAGGVLVAPDGHALYFNDAESSGSTSCTGACAQQWPPVGGPVTAGGGLTAAQLGTRTRSDGTIQATYQGHALYEFAGDRAPGDHKGDGLKDQGGTWHLASAGSAGAGQSSTVPSTEIMTPSSSSDSSSPSYNY